ncbi:MAG: GAF domain-containing protein [Verrucomicrobiales bacterium]|nr:GAF domain-containing protein [Verrucomicrobiales bacterium]
MPDTSHPANPQRPADVARLQLTKLRIEDGVALESVFQQLTETAAATLNVERVGIWLLAAQRRELRCVDLFERSKNLHSVGLTLSTDELPDYLTALDERKTIPAEVAQEDPRTSALVPMYLAPLGITSTLNAGIFVGGEIVGVVSHEHIGPEREWTTEDRDFAGSMADLLGLKIRAAEYEEARMALRTQAGQLAEARRLDSLAAMAAGVAHDFNNVLGLIIGGADMILLDPKAESVTEFAQTIKSASERGKALARELMVFAHPEPHSSRVIRPAEVIAAQLPLLRSAAGEKHSVELEVRPNSGRVLIAPDQLERALNNLVVNARDAMPEGGLIRLTVAAVVAPDEDGKTGRHFLIEVADQGTGIPANLLSRIFDPFFTTKPRGQGTGLGLAVVHQVITYAGGFIRIETEMGKGTTFRIYLPLASHD